MYVGLAVSTLLHVGLLAWVILSIQATPHLPLPDAPTIEAQIITPSEFTKLRQGDPNSKKMTAKPKEEPKPEVAKEEAPKPKPKAAPPPPTEDEVAKKLEAQKKLEEEKKAAEAKKKAEAEAKAKAEAEAKKKAEEAKKKAEAEKKRKEAERKKKLAEKKRKAKKKKRKFDADRIAALLDKTPEKRGGERSSATDRESDYEGPVAGEREGRGLQLTAREEDLLKGRINSQLRECWRLPGGGGGSSIPVVTVKWNLNRDGSLRGTPKVVGHSSSPAFRVAAENAVRAVVQCAPYRLPRDKYEAWRSITWDFDPRAML